MTQPVQLQPHYLRTTPDGKYTIDLSQVGMDPWQSPAYLGGFEGNVQFRRDPFGRVYLRGAVFPANPNSGFPAGPGPALQLPAGYFDGHTGQWVVPGPGYLTVATLLADGTVVINEQVMPFEAIDLDVISFSVT